MDDQPKILVWNFSQEEKEKLDDLLKRIEAPAAVSIESNQGHVTLREIISENARSDKELTSDEKVVLFHGIPQKGVFFLINIFREAGLPRPIYAVVTEHSIEWPFCKLLEHLVQERDEMEKERAAKGDQ